MASNQGTAQSVAGSEPEVVELQEGVGYESASPFEMVDGDSVPTEAEADRAITGPDVADDEAAPAQGSAPQSPAQLSQLDPDEGPVEGADPDDASGHRAPVVVGTIEHISSPTALADDAGGSDEISDIARSMASLPGTQPAAQTVPTEERPDTADSQQAPRGMSLGSTPSQPSYGCTNSQESLSRALDATAPFEGASGQDISKRDSAIYLDKRTDEDLAIAAEHAVARQDEEEEDSVVPTAATEEGRGVMSPFSTFSTPAFPEYFS
ncbi:hypothetical protein IWQ56_004506, partial [Coemansia nantahalensis]